MALKTLLKKLYDFYPEFDNSDFIIGKDSFKTVEIDNNANQGFWFFRNSQKGLIKRFVLEQTSQIQKICVVTLIKKKNGKFTPRFDFQIWNITQKAFEEFSKQELSEKLIKAKVSLDSCYEQFMDLINFVKQIEEIDFDSKAYAVIDREKKDIFEDLSKDIAIQKLKEKYGTTISEKDIELLSDRREKLNIFKKLLTDNSYFTEKKLEHNIQKDESLWQKFFEMNPWIFGYGLQLISCEGLDDAKLETTVVGNDIIDGNGKRIDALLKTKGNISKFIFCEIKNHYENLLIEEYPGRPGVFVPAKDLRGAVAQVQKTIHKVTLKLQNSFIAPKEENGDPTGEEILFVKPKGIIVIGVLNDFKVEKGINYEKLSSFELYRQQINGIEIITYDELYERVKFIVEK